MRLTRLELSGFKSFADAVTMAFDDGITAIVGPNGCGKSNISDAVRWVLGEQRPRLLRGTRMDDVIFQGTAKRRPINIAEVALVFDNSAGVLPISYDEVLVTRRLSRSGQSDYLLNQSSVRLRDVQDLLRGTGLGSDAGVVIEAQMIDRLLSDRAEERRSLFEEAAGIGLYRDRKESTERRLEKTADDLQRLSDLIAEIQTQVRSLARQRGKAERHQKFTAERFAIVMTLARREFREFDEQYTALREHRDRLRLRVPEARDRLAERERQREARVQERETSMVRRAEVERRLTDTRLEVERLEGDLNLAAERLEHAAARKTRAGEERTHSETRAAQAKRELEAAALERDSAQTARASVQTELDLRVATESDAREQLTQQRTALREVESGLQSTAEQLRALAGERAALEREEQDLTIQEAETAERHADAEQVNTDARQRLDEGRATASLREREEREAAAKLEQARHALASAREHEAAIRIEQREAEQTVAQLVARREALDELERKREGLAPAVRQLLEAREQFGDGAVLGPLSDFVAAAVAQAGIVERLLADWLQAVLVRDDQAVDAVRRWHAEAEPGPLLLLPITPGPERRVKGRPPPLELDVRAPADAWVTALLAGSDLRDADGTAITRGNGAVYLPGPQATGPLSRRAELDQLADELQAADRRRAELTQAADRAAEAHSVAEQTLQSATETSALARRQLLEAQGASDEASRHLHRADRERTEAKESLERIHLRIAERTAKLEQVSTDVSSDEAERRRLEQKFSTVQKELMDLEAAQEAARERRVHWQVEEAQVSAREEAAKDRQVRAEQALAHAQEEMAQLDTELVTIDDEVETLSKQQTQWAETLAERRVAVQELAAAQTDAETSVQAAEDLLTAQEQAVAEARNKLEEMNEELHRLELELTEAEGRRRALVERIEGEWHKPIDVLLKDAPEVEGDLTSLQAEADRLTDAVEKLGPVNPLAVEEHAEEVKRLEFLTSQQEDLIEARKSLQQALREIDQTAKQMFVETFAAIQEHFHTVFRTLFEGGECDVRLTDESDPLTSEIEIHAAPRGKRTQRIHLLSSGERALVAISLLFAIYLTKPAPFCLLDEVDAPLDDANVMRFVLLLDEFKNDTQFIVITHNPRTMQVADAVYGVTMQEPGVSTIVGVRLGEVSAAAS